MHFLGRHHSEDPDHRHRWQTSVNMWEKIQPGWLPHLFSAVWYAWGHVEIPTLQWLSWCHYLSLAKAGASSSAWPCHPSVWPCPSHPSAEHKLKKEFKGREKEDDGRLEYELRYKSALGLHFGSHITEDGTHTNRVILTIIKPQVSTPTTVFLDHVYLLNVKC